MSLAITEFHGNLCQGDRRSECIVILHVHDLHMKRYNELTCLPTLEFKIVLFSSAVLLLPLRVSTIVGLITMKFLPCSRFLKIVLFFFLLMTEFGCTTVQSMMETAL